jgi:hypothetical protein
MGLDELDKASTNGNSANTYENSCVVPQRINPSADRTSADPAYALGRLFGGLYPPAKHSHDSTSPNPVLFTLAVGFILLEKT